MSVAIAPIILFGLGALIGPGFWMRWVYGYYGRWWPQLQLTEENLQSPWFWLRQRIAGLFFTLFGCAWLYFTTGFNVLDYPIVIAGLLIWVVVACIRTFPRDPPPRIVR